MKRERAIRESPLQQRKAIRLKGYDYSQAGAYFITICPKKRGYVFGNIVDGKVRLSEIGRIASEFWSLIPFHFRDIELDEFVIMPNHIHGIVVVSETCVGAIHELPPQRRKMLLPRVLGWFKMNSAKRINIMLQKSGQPFWQRNYYEHIIRSESELHKIREYVTNNPLKWELDFENPERKKDYKNFTDYLRDVGAIHELPQ